MVSVAFPGLGWERSCRFSRPMQDFCGRGFHDPGRRESPGIQPDGELGPGHGPATRQGGDGAPGVRPQIRLTAPGAQVKFLAASCTSAAGWRFGGNRAPAKRHHVH